MMIADRQAERPSTEAFGRRLAIRLSQGEHDLPAAHLERLRVARLQALAHRKTAPHRAPRPVLGARFAALIRFEPHWLRLASWAPMAALLAGLWLIDRVQGERIVNETAEMELKLLTDRLPLDAFTDPGFAEFIKQDQRKTHPGQA